MAISTYRLRSKFEISKICELIQNSYEELSDDWSLQKNFLSLKRVFDAYRLKENYIKKNPDDWMICSTGNEGEWIALQLRKKKENILSDWPCRSSFFFNNNKSSNIISSLENEFCKDFLIKLAKKFGIVNERLQYESEWKETPVLRKGSGILLGDLSSKYASISLLFSSKIINQWFNSYYQPDLGTLINIKDIVNETKINISVNLNDIFLENDQIAKLKVGDVLISEHKYIEPFKVLINKKNICSGFLGKNKDFRAIQLQ